MCSEHCAAVVNTLRSAFLYRVIFKKVSFGIVLIFLIFEEEKKFNHGKQRQSATSEQVFMIFGHAQNHQN